MKDYLALTGLEVKLIFRSKLFWILGGLSVLLSPLPSVTFLLGQFILIYQFTRDERIHISGLLNPLPYDAARLCLARVSAAFLALLSLGPFMLAVVVFFPEAKLAEWVFLPGNIFFLACTYFLFCLTQVSLVLLFRTFTSNLLFLYFLSVVCWIATMTIAGNLGILPEVFKFFVFGQGFMLPSAPSAAVGYFPLQNIFPGFAVFQIGTVLLFATLFISGQLFLHHQRIVRSLPVIVLLFFSLAALLGGSYTALKELDHRERDFKELIQTSYAENIPPAVAEAAFTPETYDLSVKLKTASHYFDGKAVIKGKVSGLQPEKISFTLNECFTVADVRELPAGVPLKWERKGSILTVYLPKSYTNGQTLTLAISYGGEVWEWAPDRMAQVNGPVNFIAPQYSLLRSGCAWYPVSGIHDLYSYCEYIDPITKRTQRALNSQRLIHPPLPFSVTVDTDTEEMVASNLSQTAEESLSGEYKRRYRFYSETGHDVFLISGPYERQLCPTPDGTVTVYDFPAHKEQSRRVVDSLTDMYGFYKDMMQGKNGEQKSSDPPYTVIEAPPFFFYSEEGKPLKNLTLTDSIVLSENYFKADHLMFGFLNEIRNNKRDMATLQRWWQEDLSGTSGISRSGNICSSLSYYLYIMGLERTSLPDAYTRARKNAEAQENLLLGDFCLPWLPDSAVTREVFLTLDALRTELGNQALKETVRALYTIYAKKGDITDADFSQTIEEVLAKSNFPAEKKTEVEGRLHHIGQLMTADVPLPIDGSSTLYAFDMEEFLP